ncbi:PEGA domain-containing protein [Hymenobacter negativus]|uniref:PEGA domain-containing protein n=1 Tax=Hymenobacter negativus TaxID=2795026 RepID=A0ABS3QEP0_9BACT|nr:PEGA domain-containing protein [Hymenobacter negativus]MBO2009453.1 PEGA domain-containing protein [Hymenobacter negativus]
MVQFSFGCRLVASLSLSGTVLLSSCSSTTVLQSMPVGARVYVDGESVGTTPYRHSDTKIVGSTTSVRMEKEGFETYTTSFSRDEQADVGAIIGGVFVLVPFLWTMKYKPVHSYELKPLSPVQQPGPVVVPSAKPRTDKPRAERLRENKKLLDEKILTPQEYEKEKQRILAEPE